uniref:Apple domain-containing protein n=1 Tax=Branchiostoma floridae TaxID=7739 RepID=C3YWE1_BRAFL|eukprot:XP_002599173.1 hypothetical protein BRAFLDRAFT_64472 [Branchiostoma floridae]
MSGTRFLSGAVAVLMLATAATAGFHPVSSGLEFPRAVALDRTLVDIPHRLLCHELCLKDASCASFQYNQTSRECSISISPDSLEDKPGDEVDDSLHDLDVGSVLPMAAYSRKVELTALSIHISVHLSGMCILLMMPLAMTISNGVLARHTS